jgi:hypothetical protein
MTSGTPALKACESKPRPMRRDILLIVNLK